VIARPLRVVACVACVAAAATGAARAAQPQLTAHAYLAKANAICAKFNGYELPRGGNMADQLSAMVVKGRASLDRLRVLHPPRSLAKLHTRVIDADSRQLALLAALLPQLRTGKLTLVQLGARMHASGFGDQANALWKQIGAVDCVRY
jgi:hypothetical protein